MAPLNEAQSAASSHPHSWVPLTPHSWCPSIRPGPLHPLIHTHGNPALGLDYCNPSPTSMALVTEAWATVSLLTVTDSLPGSESLHSHSLVYTAALVYGVWDHCHFHLHSYLVILIATPMTYSHIGTPAPQPACLYLPAILFFR